MFLSRPARNEKWSLKIKTANPGFEEDIPMVHQDDDYDDYTSDTDRVDET